MGRCFSKELGVFYNLAIYDSTLVILIRNTPEIELSALKKDIYKGSVTGLKASNGRTKGIGFERL